MNFYQIYFSDKKCQFSDAASFTLWAYIYNTFQLSLISINDTLYSCNLFKDTQYSNVSNSRQKSCLIRCTILLNKAKCAFLTGDYCTSVAFSNVFSLLFSNAKVTNLKITEVNLNHYSLVVDFRIHSRSHDVYLGHGQSIA